MVVRESFDCFFEAIEVELVFDEILVYFAEEAVVLESAEPLDPAHVGLLTELGFLAHCIIILI